MINFLSLSSGSSGNCYFFTDGKVSFLIDAGVGPRTSAKKLSGYGFSLKQIDFILVTHDHIDHIKALGIISSRYHKPVYTTGKLKSALLENICTRGRMHGNLHVLEEGCTEKICGIDVCAFEVPHDATQTVGYHLCIGGKKITVITDCGKVTPLIESYAKKADILILESNYDSDMLKSGGYSQLLQERIRGGSGHLSNSQAAQTLRNIYADKAEGPSRIFLCHISDNNNIPALALEKASEALPSDLLAKGRVRVDALPRGKASELYSL